MTPADDLIVIGCGKQKARVPFAKARDLYTGPLFKAHYRLAKSNGGPHYILSGKHGLIPVDRSIANYDTTMTGAGAVQRQVWSDMVLEQFRALERPKRLVVICGKPYLGKWHRTLLDDGWTISTPLMGLAIGRRLAKVNSLLGGNNG